MLLVAYEKMLGNEYLRETLTAPLLEALKHLENCEMDPQKLKKKFPDITDDQMETKLLENRLNLEKSSAILFDIIFDSPKKFPDKIKGMCAFLSKTIHAFSEADKVKSPLSTTILSSETNIPIQTVASPTQEKSAPELIPTSPVSKETDNSHLNKDERVGPASPKTDTSKSLNSPLNIDLEATRSNEISRKNVESILEEINSPLADKQVDSAVETTPNIAETDPKSPTEIPSTNLKLKEEQKAKTGKTTKFAEDTVSVGGSKATSVVLKNKHLRTDTGTSTDSNFSTPFAVASLFLQSESYMNDSYESLSAMSKKVNVDTQIASPKEKVANGKSEPASPNSPAITKPENIDNVVGAQNSDSESAQLPKNGNIQEKESNAKMKKPSIISWDLVAENGASQKDSRASVATIANIKANNMIHHDKKLSELAESAHSRTDTPPQLKRPRARTTFLENLNTAEKVVGSFIFLRFIVPGFYLAKQAITTPETAGIEIEKISPNTRRGLILCGKLLTSLCNDNEFGNKDVTLIPCNDFLKPYRRPMKLFLDNCSDPKYLPSTNATVLYPDSHPGHSKHQSEDGSMATTPRSIRAKFSNLKSKLLRKSNSSDILGQKNEGDNRSHGRSLSELVTRSREILNSESRKTNKGSADFCSPQKSSHSATDPDLGALFYALSRTIDKLEKDFIEKMKCKSDGPETKDTNDQAAQATLNFYEFKRLLILGYTTMDINEKITQEGKGWWKRFKQMIKIS
jgi:hypothetical protein